MVMATTCPLPLVVQSYSAPLLTQHLLHAKQHSGRWKVETQVKMAMLRHSLPISKIDDGHAVYFLLAVQGNAAPLVSDYQ
jgi:hypothetical protein